MSRRSLDTSMPTKTVRCSSITLPCKCGLGPERLSGRGTAVVETAPSSVSGFRAPGGRGLASTFSLAGLVSAGNSDIQGRDHSRPLRFSAWRRYQVRRDISSFSQGFLASMVLARSSMRGRPLRARFIVVEGGCARAATYYLSIYLCMITFAALSISGKSVLSLIPIISSALRRFDFAVLGILILVSLIPL